MSKQLIYLSAPFGGRIANVSMAERWLAWAQRYTIWGQWVQAPWISSARAWLLFRGDLPDTIPAIYAAWVASGGLDVEHAMQSVFSGVLHVRGDQSPGQQREAKRCVQEFGGRVWRVLDGEGMAGPPGPWALTLEETTEHWR